MMIVCECARCLDPTEFGTGFGGVVCAQCSDLSPESGDGVEKGVLLPTVVSMPGEESSEWKCSNCSATMSGEEGWFEHDCLVGATVNTAHFDFRSEKVVCSQPEHRNGSQ